MPVTAAYVTALVRRHLERDDEGFYSVALQVAARAARDGNISYPRSDIDTPDPAAHPRALSGGAESFDRQGVAERAGVDLAFVERLVELGVLAPGDGDRFTTGDVQRVGVALGLERGGLSLKAVGDATRRGDLSLGFVDQPSYHRFGAVGSESFEELSDRTGIPLEVLMTLREAMGFAQPSPQDRVRDDELLVIPLIELQLREGFRTTVIERWLRVYGESMRRVADTEAELVQVRDPRAAVRGWKESS